jgi:soluble lytic murein transglycosylase-like protein
MMSPGTRKESDPMAEIRTSRPYQERFLDGYDRRQLREEVQKVKPASRFRKKYATLALGASLALGGLGIPMKMIQKAEQRGASGRASSSSTGSVAENQSAIRGDLAQAASIAQQVAGGVEAAAKGIESAAMTPLSTVAEAPKKLTIMTEGVKESFFKREIPFGSIIYQEARRNDLPPELVAAVVHTESKFSPTARSHAGAVGLMQLVPRTARWMGARNPLNPAENISAGAKYLRYLTDRFDGDTQKAIAAYNAGEGNVRRFGGVPPFRETRNYIARVRDYQQDLGDRIEGSAPQSLASADAR